MVHERFEMILNCRRDVLKRSPEQPVVAGGTVSVPFNNDLLL